MQCSTLVIVLVFVCAATARGHKGRPMNRAHDRSGALLPSATRAEIRDAIVLLEQARVTLCEAEQELSLSAKTESRRHNRVASLKPIFVTHAVRVAGALKHFEKATRHMSAVMASYLEFVPDVDRIGDSRRRAAGAAVELQRGLRESVANVTIVRDDNFLDLPELRFWNSNNVAPEEIVAAAVDIREQVKNDMESNNIFRQQNARFEDVLAGYTAHCELVSDVLSKPIVVTFLQGQNLTECSTTLEASGELMLATGIADGIKDLIAGFRYELDKLHKVCVQRSSDRLQQTQETVDKIIRLIDTVASPAGQPVIGRKVSAPSNKKKKKKKAKSIPTEGSANRTESLTSAVDKPAINDSTVSPVTVCGALVTSSSVSAARDNAEVIDEDGDGVCTIADDLPLNEVSPAANKATVKNKRKRKQKSAVKSQRQAHDGGHERRMDTGDEDASVSSNSSLSSFASSSADRRGNLRAVDGPPDHEAIAVVPVCAPDTDAPAETPATDPATPTAGDVSDSATDMDSVPPSTASRSRRSVRIDDVPGRVPLNFSQASPGSPATVPFTRIHYPESIARQPPVDSPTAPRSRRPVIDSIHVPVRMHGGVYWGSHSPGTYSPNTAPVTRSRSPLSIGRQLSLDSQTAPPQRALSFIDVQDAKLTDHLNEFMAFAEHDRRHDDTPRQQGYHAIRHAVHHLFPDAIVRVTGSFVYGLHLSAPVSDLDLAIEYRMVKASDGLSRLYDRIRASPVFLSVTYLPRASTPVIKATVADSQVNIDIAWNVDNVDRAQDFVRQATTVFPLFKPITMYMKHYLYMFGFGNPYYGGLGSFQLYLLVIFHLQANAVLCARSVGACLRTFFGYYGSTFQVQRHCISVFAGGRPYDKDERIHDGPVDATRLCIENPFNRAIDVGRSAFNFEAIRQQMAMTFKKLMSTWEVTGLGDLTPRVPVAPSSTLRMSPRPTA